MRGYSPFECISKTADAALAAKFAPLAQGLADGEAAILAELSAGQGQAVDLGGYYNPPADKAAAAMRPSATLNALIG